MTTLRCIRYPTLLVATRHGQVRFRDGVAEATPEQAESVTGLGPEYGITADPAPDTAPAGTKRTRSGRPARGGEA